MKQHSTALATAAATLWRAKVREMELSRDRRERVPLRTSASRGRGRVDASRRQSRPDGAQVEFGHDRGGVPGVRALNGGPLQP